MQYLHEKQHWTTFRWNKEAVNTLLEQVQEKLHDLHCKAGRLLPQHFKHVELEMLTNEVVYSSKIERQYLDVDNVKGYAANKLSPTSQFVLY